MKYAGKNWLKLILLYASYTLVSIVGAEKDVRIG